MHAFRLPGHEVLELLGLGDLGEVWRARRGAELVVLRRLPPVAEEALAEVRRQATVVRSLTSRHLVRLKTVTRAQGEDVLVLDHAARGSLESLLASRGTLSPGEVVTVLAPLAEVLAAAHAEGLQHRRLSASRVLLDADGRPLLDGLGLDPLRDPDDSLDPTGALGPTADVWGLGALGHRMLTGADPGHPPQLPATVPAPLAEALTAALDPDPFARPSGAELGAALLASCPAVPLTGLPEPVLLPVPPARERRPRLSRRALVAAAGVAALLLVVAVGWAWGSRTAPATARVAAVRPDWAAVLYGLDRTRSAAFATGSAGPLARVYPRGSPLLAADEAALGDLRSRQVTARGLGHRFLAVTETRHGQGSVSLLVTEQLTAYVLVDRAGRVVERHLAGPVQRVTVALAGSGGSWRVSRVGPAP